MKRICLASLKFSPGHYSHLRAFKQLFEELGYRVELLLDGGYKPFVEADGERASYCGEGKLPLGCELLLVYNLSTRDGRLIAKMRAANPALKVLFVYHEPYRGFGETFESLLRGERGAKHFASIMGRHAFSRRVLRMSNVVLLPSASAVREYGAFDKRYGERHAFFPLIFKDENPEFGSLKKRYFSYISTALPAKGFLEFLAFAKKADACGEGILFQIVTKSDVSRYLDGQLEAMADKGTLLLKHGHPHSNEVVNRAYAESLCTWFAYNKSTQSGVLCKSYMFGSPGMATRVGAFPEYVTDETGVLIGDNTDYEEILSAYRKIEAGIDSYSHAARQMYLDEFDYSAALGKMREILGELE